MPPQIFFESISEMSYIHYLSLSLSFLYLHVLTIIGSRALKLFEAIDSKAYILLKMQFQRLEAKSVLVIDFSFNCNVRMLRLV